MNRIKQLAGQTVIYGGGKILSKLVYFLLIHVLLTYLLDGQQEQFGVFGSFYAYAAVFIILFSLRLDTALFRFGTEVEDRIKAFNTSFTAVVCSALVLIVIAVFAHNYIAQWTVSPERPIYVRWFAFILAFDIISLIPYARLRLDDKARAFAFFQILNVVIASFLIIFFLYLLPRLPDSIQSIFPVYESIIDYVFISNLIASFLILILLLINVKGISFSIDKPLLKKMFFYIGPLIIVGIANSFIQYFAVPLQEEYLGGSSKENLSQGGIYESSRRISNLFAMFTTAFNYAAEPFFFKNASKEDRHLYYGKICHFFILVGGLIILGMVVSLDLLQYLAGASFRESIFVVPILLIGYLFLGIYYNVSIWYKISDNTIYGAIISCCGLFVFMVINIIFLPKYGYVTTAWATPITYGLMVLIAFVLGQKMFPINYPVQKILTKLVVIITLIILLSYIKGLVHNTIYYIIGGITILTYMVYMYLTEREEWNQILKIKRT
jgi:O-antigen/teichoic acid export membrane protein